MNLINGHEIVTRPIVSDNDLGGYDHRKYANHTGPSFTGDRRGSLYRRNGHTILREKTNGGKEFTPIEVEGTKGYTLRQVFESEDEEGLYGLGQHQSDEFNYKGKNEELFQYNTKVSVPFIVSSKGYGVLWHNYSLSRFGDKRPYADLGDVFGYTEKTGGQGR